MSSPEDLPDTSWTNPFLRNMPMVAIVRQVAIKNGGEVALPETRVRRVWFRVGNHRAVPAPTTVSEMMPTNSAHDKLTGFDNLKPYP